MKFFTRFTKIGLLLFGCLAGWQTALEAQRTIVGYVKDNETGEALIGASIVEKGSSANGTVADIDGKFSLKIGSSSSVIICSYTGYEAMEMPVGAANVLNFSLSSGKLLQDVVIIGYGTVKREDATGLVQTVGSDRFNKGAITGAQELLAGKIPGVVITTDGSPGGGSRIRIRGESSISASNNPLIVVDGVPLSTIEDGNLGGISGGRNLLNLINPNDIETFTVLKDASAAAIYGNRAAAGVIIITTKKGKLGKKVSVGYSNSFSLGKVIDRIDALSADEFRAAVNKKYFVADPDKPQHPAIGLLGSANTDWQDQIFQNAFGQDHNLNVSGGIGTVPYRVSLGFTSKEGLLKTDFFDRYTGALNLNPGFLNNTLQVNFGVKGMLSNNRFADKGAIGNALSFDPTQTVRDTGTAYGGYWTWKIPNGRPNGLATTNPVALLELKEDNSTVSHIITNGSIDYRMPFLPALRANLNLAYDYSKGEGTVVIPNFAAFSFDAINGGGENNLYEQTKKNSLLETYLNYKKQHGRHDVDLMGGYSWQRFQIDNYFKNSDSAGTPAETRDGSDPSENYLISMFGRLNYGFADRYLLTLSMRRDGSSRFAEGNRWGNFPAAALAVKIIDRDDHYFDQLKLRLSVGITGQQEIGNDKFVFSIYQTGEENAQYQFGNTFVTTIRPNAYVSTLQWEKTTTYNIGVDFGLVKNRLSGSLDVYQRNTGDLLNTIPFSALSNLSNIGTTNIGTMETKGLELGLTTTPVLTKKVRWDLGINVAHNRSEITKLTTSDDPKYLGVATGGIAGGVGSNIQIHTVGYSPSSFFVHQQKYDAAGNILEGQFVDLNGDSLINDFDKYRYKNPAARFTFGLTSNLTVGKFDLSFAGRASVGNYVYNNIQTDMGYLNRLFGTTKYLSNVNQSAVDLNVVDQAKLTFSDHFVTDASFFRIDHITAGYSFSKFIGKSALRVYATIQNPMLVTNYEGLDPEIDTGIDNNVYPRPRTYLAGFSVNF